MCVYTHTQGMPPADHLTTPLSGSGQVLQRETNPKSKTWPVENHSLKVDWSHACGQALRPPPSREPSTRRLVMIGAARRLPSCTPTPPTLTPL